ncbi:MAG: hemerythrin domain-containing protein [Nitrospiraceae bacterium]
MSQSDTVRGFFEHDHDRLDGLFASFRSQYTADRAAAQSAFAAFRAGLAQHIVWEEELLFPLWEAKTGMTQAGPTVVMRHEHRQIHPLLEQLQRESDKGENIEATAQLLSDILAAHNMKEERVLYPAIDQALTDEQRVTVFDKIEHSRA